MSRVLLLLCLTSPLLAGCAEIPIAPMSAVPAAAPNVVYIQGGNPELVWEQVVDVLNDYPFEIARENKLDGVIETEYKVGSSLLEPWHQETIGFWNRMESSLHPIRRKVFVTITPSEAGYAIAVRADKEIADTPQQLPNTPGGATFLDNHPLQRQLDAVVGDRPRIVGWVPRGRDMALEYDLTARLQAVFSR